MLAKKIASIPSEILCEAAVRQRVRDDNFAIRDDRLSQRDDRRLQKGDASTNAAKDERAAAQNALDQKVCGLYALTAAEAEWVLGA